MAKKKGRKAPPARAVAVPNQPPPSSEFWQNEMLRLGRKVLFVDTGAIVGCVEPNDARFVAFFEEELVGDRLVTSTYVVAETVRRIIKSKYGEFVGPSGERGIDLALHVLKVWLVENQVTVLNVPDEVFETAKQSLEDQRHAQCDLTDILSFEIVRGLGQNRIVSPDVHFKVLGLTCYPQT